MNVLKEGLVTIDDVSLTYSLAAKKLQGFNNGSNFTSSFIKISGCSFLRFDIKSKNKNNALHNRSNSQR